jgi:hypothetical protein
MIIPSEYTYYNNRDILLTYRTEDSIRRIFIFRSYPAYFLLAYTLLFPYN